MTAETAFKAQICTGGAELESNKTQRRNKIMCVRKIVTLGIYESFLCITVKTESMMNTLQSSHLYFTV